MCKAAGVFGPKYRATRAPHGPCSFYAVVGRVWAICAYPGRSVGRSGRRRRPPDLPSPQWGVVHEHTRRPTPPVFNTKKSIRICTDRSGHVGADHQHLNNTRQLPSIDGAFDGRLLQHCESRFLGLLPPNFPLTLFIVHEQTTPAALRTVCK